MVDMVVHRHDLRDTLSRLCRMFMHEPEARQKASGAIAVAPNGGATVANGAGALNGNGATGLANGELSNGEAETALPASQSNGAALSNGGASDS